MIHKLKNMAGFDIEMLMQFGVINNNIIGFLKSKKQLQKTQQPIWKCLVLFIK